MIAEHLPALEDVTSTKQACELLGASRATVLRRRRDPLLGPPAPRPAPPNKLTEPERQHILGVLRFARVLRSGARAGVGPAAR